MLKKNCYFETYEVCNWNLKSMKNLEVVESHLGSQKYLAKISKKCFLNSLAVVWNFSIPVRIWWLCLNTFSKLGKRVIVLCKRLNTGSFLVAKLKLLFYLLYNPSIFIVTFLHSLRFVVIHDYSVQRCLIFTDYYIIYFLYFIFVFILYDDVKMIFNDYFYVTSEG